MRGPAIPARCANPHHPPEEAWQRNDAKHAVLRVLTIPAARANAASNFVPRARSSACHGAKQTRADFSSAKEFARRKCQSLRAPPAIPARRVPCAPCRQCSAMRPREHRALQTQRFRNAQAHAIKQREQRNRAPPSTPHHGCRLLPMCARHPPRSADVAGCAPNAACARRGRLDYRQCFRAPDNERAAHRRDCALYPARTQSIGPARRDKGANIGRLQRRQHAVIHRAAHMQIQKLQKPRAIIAIGTQGVRTGAPFMRQTRKPCAFQIFGRSSHARIVRSSARAKKPRSAAVSSPSNAPSALPPKT